MVGVGIKSACISSLKEIRGKIAAMTVGTAHVAVEVKRGTLPWWGGGGSRSPTEEWSDVARRGGGKWRRRLSLCWSVDLGKRRIKRISKTSFPSVEA